MIELKALVCECCGGQIDRRTMRCKYCGTEYYVKDENVFRVETYNAPVKEMMAGMSIPREAVLNYGDEYRKFVLEKLSRKLADEMLDCMQVHSGYDPLTQEYVVKARVKAIVPVDSVVNGISRNGCVGTMI